MITHGVRGDRSLNPSGEMDSKFYFPDHFTILIYSYNARVAIFIVKIKLYCIYTYTFEFEFPKVRLRDTRKNKNDSPDLSGRVLLGRTGRNCPNMEILKP